MMFKSFFHGLNRSLGNGLLKKMALEKYLPA